VLVNKKRLKYLTNTSCLQVVILITNLIINNIMLSHKFYRRRGNSLLNVEALTLIRVGSGIREV